MTVLSSLRRLAVATLIAVGSPGLAATLVTTDFNDRTIYADADPIFSTIARRDQNVLLGGQAGADLFVYDASERLLGTGNHTWPTSGTSINWSLSYQNGLLTFVMGNARGTFRTTAATWDGFWFELRAVNGYPLSFASTTVQVTRVNGADLTQPTVFSVTNGTGARSYSMDDGQAISTMEGAIRFNYNTALLGLGTPGDQLQARFIAYDADPLILPVPGSAVLLVSALGGLMLMRRHRA